jgi:hypothetical protein
MRGIKETEDTLPAARFHMHVNGLGSLVDRPAAWINERVTDGSK